jgi:hypothetical protein
VKHRIARQLIIRRLPRFIPRTMAVTLLSTPIAKPVLRRVYDHYMRTKIVARRGDRIGGSEQS